VNRQRSFLSILLGGRNAFISRDPSETYQSGIVGSCLARCPVSAILLPFTRLYFLLTLFLTDPLFSTRLENASARAFSFFYVTLPSALEILGEAGDARLWWFRLPSPPPVYYLCSCRLPRSVLTTGGNGSHVGSCFLKKSRWRLKESFVPCLRISFFSLSDRDYVICRCSGIGCSGS